MLARAPRTETPRAFCPSAEQAPGCADNVPDGDSDCDVILTEPIHAQDELCWGTGYMRFAVGAPSVLLVFLLCLALAPPHVWAIAACGLCVLLEVGYVLDSRAEWEEHHMTRVQRDHPASPSHHERPPLRRQSEHAAYVVKLAKLSKQANSAASACDEDEGPQQGRRKRSSLSSFLLKKFRLSLITETIAALGAKQSTPIVGRDRHQLRRLSSSPFRESFLLDSDEDSTDRMATTQPQSTVVSPSLDMNHVPLSWNDYLWVAHVVAIPQIMFFIFGMAKMMVIDLLRRCGLPRCATEEQTHVMICNLLLETSLAMSVLTVVPDVVTGDDVATFAFPGFPHFENVLDEAGKPRCTDEGVLLKQAGRDTLLVVKLNLSTRRFVEGKLGLGTVRMEDLHLLLAMHLVRISTRCLVQKGGNRPNLHVHVRPHAQNLLPGAWLDRLTYPFVRLRCFTRARSLPRSASMFIPRSTHMPTGQSTPLTLSIHTSAR